MRMDDGSTRLLKESSDIIDELVAATQAAPVGDAAEQKQWRTWVDEKWVRVVTVNIYRTVGESLQTFDYMTSLGYLIQPICTASLCGTLCRARALSLCVSRCVYNIRYMFLGRSRKFSAFESAYVKYGGGLLMYVLYLIIHLSI